jgi:entericidin A
LGRGEIGTTFLLHQKLIFQEDDMKKIFALLIAMIVLAGCNTVQGFGKDVQKVGGKVENAAQK